MRKFWNFKTLKNEEKEERVLYLNGTIAEDSWFDDEVTPEIFKAELNKENGDLSIWINSPGGDVIAAARIYNMLREYKGDITVKIDGLAASAASVIAMAGKNVLMSPVSMMMIHNPMTLSFGDKEEMKKSISMLDEVKESIINAYEIKTGLKRSKISSLMDMETWMNAYKAIELGFSDGLIENEKQKVDNTLIMHQRVKVNRAFVNKVMTSLDKKGDVNADALLDRLNLIKNWR